MRPSFIARNPEVTLSFNLTDRVVDLVREGYDLGVRIGGAIDPQLRGDQAGCQSGASSAATPAYVERPRPSARRWTTCERHNCLAFNLQGGQQRGWHFRQDGKTDCRCASDGNLDCNDGELLHRWASEGLGLGVAARRGRSQARARSAASS